MNWVYAIVVAILVVSVLVSSAVAERRASSRSLRILNRALPSTARPGDRVPAGAHEITTSAGRTEVPRLRLSRQQAQALAPRVMGVRLRTAVPAEKTELEENPDWFLLPERAEKKPFRPKVMPKVMGFPTGGGGVGVKIRI